MVRTACHRFVLPTPLSRWPAHSWSQVQFPPARDAACSMPVNNAAERALRGVALGRKSSARRSNNRSRDKRGSARSVNADAAGSVIQAGSRASVQVSLANDPMIDAGMLLATGRDDDLAAPRMVRIEDPDLDHRTPGIMTLVQVSIGSGTGPRIGVE